jgi:ribonucleotide reductase beta subunit family protein with ferritin-like domain
MSELKTIDDVFSHSNRHVLFPIQYPKLFKNYKHLQADNWIVEEVDMSRDKFEELKPEEQEFIKMILAFFASADGLVNENIALNMHNMTEIPEIRQFYATQMYNEAVHNEMYSVLIDTYIKDPIERHNIFNAANDPEKYGFLKQKKDWFETWVTNKDATKQERLIVTVITEGVLFSGSFAAIFWIKSRGKTPGLCTSNEFISRDENCHAQEACDIYNMIPEHLRIPTEHTHKMFHDAVEIESEFMSKSLPVSMIGMNAQQMIQHIKFTADLWLDQLNYPKLYNVHTPFSFMVTLGMESKTNFFEKRVTNYSKSSQISHNFELNDDF